jgi:hypothetical protein
MDNVLILNKIKEHYKIATNAEFSRFLGIKPNVLTNWFARNSIDYSIIVTKCVDIDANWLLSGIGSMLKDNNENKPKESPPCPPPPPVTTCTSCEAKDAAIQAMKTTIETQAKYIKMLEAQSPTEVGQQKKQDSNVTSPHEGQKRKAVVNEVTQ